MLQLSEQRRLVFRCVTFVDLGGKLPLLFALLSLAPALLLVVSFIEPQVAMRSVLVLLALVAACIVVGSPSAPPLLSTRWLRYVARYLRDNSD